MRQNYFTQNTKSEGAEKLLWGENSTFRLISILSPALPGGCQPDNVNSKSLKLWIFYLEQFRPYTPESVVVLVPYRSFANLGSFGISHPDSGVLGDTRPFQVKIKLSGEVLWCSKYDEGSYNYWSISKSWPYWLWLWDLPFRHWIMTKTANTTNWLTLAFTWHWLLIS